MQNSIKNLEEENSRLERENKLLIEEITHYRNEHPMGEKSPDKKRSGIKLNKLEPEIIEDASYDPLFSED